MDTETVSFFAPPEHDMSSLLSDSRVSLLARVRRFGSAGGEPRDEV